MKEVIRLVLLLVTDELAFWIRCLIRLIAVRWLGTWRRKGRNGMALRKVAPPSAEDPARRQAAECPFLGEGWPEVYAHLVATAYPEGTRRLTSTLLIFAEDGLVKVMLKDRDNARLCFVSGPSLLDALASLEKGLVTDKLDWRADRGGPGKGKR